jgi:hypothetical protein
LVPAQVTSGVRQAAPIFSLIPAAKIQDVAMHRVSNSVQVLIEVLRGSSLPSLGEDIESHIQLGKTEEFFGDTDESALEDLQRRTFVQSDDVVRPQETEEDKSEPYSDEEQIEEALDLLTTFFEVHFAMIKDAQEIVKRNFDLQNVLIVIENAEGGKFNVTEDANRRAGLSEWIAVRSQIQNWLKSVG